MDPMEGQGSQELSNEKYNFYSGTILSGMFAMANGTAFADQYLRKIISV